MIRIIQWLGKNKLIAVLLSVALYFSIVTFHDEVTELAIRFRNAIGRDRYNDILAYAFLALLLVVISFLIYHAFKSRQKYLYLALSAIVTAMMIIASRLLMVYSIEAIHFVEYMLMAILLLPVIRSYGATVFWVTILGALDELFQYIYLTPTFEYFDFNDIILNLVGAGTGAVTVFVFAADAIKLRQIKWYKSPAVLTGMGILVIFFALLLSGKMALDPGDISESHRWFTLNRESMPGVFWTTAYPGRVFHILKPLEGIILLYLLFAGFFILDIIRVNPPHSR